MKRLFRKILDSLPYFLAAVALACGIGAFLTIKNARLDSGTFLPMLRASQDWPGVPGRVVKHSIFEKETGRFSHSPATHYFAHPVYVYAVNGEEFTNDRVCFYHSNCGTGTDREAAQALLDLYPVDGEVMVFHDPENPGRSVLRPGDAEQIQRIEKEITNQWILAVVLILVTVACLVVVVKTAKEFKGERTDS